jgi:hypothetical protein
MPWGGLRHFLESTDTVLLSCAPQEFPTISAEQKKKKKLESRFYDEKHNEQAQLFQKSAIVSRTVFHTRYFRKLGECSEIKR